MYFFFICSLKKNVWNLWYLPSTKTCSTHFKHNIQQELNRMYVTCLQMFDTIQPSPPACQQRSTLCIWLNHQFIIVIARWHVLLTRGIFLDRISPMITYRPSLMLGPFLLKWNTAAKVINSVLSPNAGVAITPTSCPLSYLTKLHVSLTPNRIQCFV